MSAPRETYAAPHEAWLTPNQASKTTKGGGEAKHRYLRADLTCGECLFSDNPVTWCIGRGIQVKGDSPACMKYRLRPVKS